MTSLLNHGPDRAMAIACAITLTCITFSSTLELFHAQTA
jgi:hypothetical protein